MLLAQYIGMKTLFYLREYFFPRGCGGCGAALYKPTDAFYGLCGECRKLLESFIALEQRCTICGKPLISEKETCLSCRNREATDSWVYNEQITLMRTLFPYAGKFKTVLGAYKFWKSLGIANFLAGCLTQVLDNFGDSGTAIKEAAWVPVPPRPGKIKNQGWDQIEHLTGLLEKAHKRSGSGIPVCRCLKRLPSRSQKELNKEERGSNLKGRILCTKQPPKTAILFDDVITTGATMNACAAALLEGGAEKVYGVCLFFD